MAAVISAAWCDPANRYAFLPIGIGRLHFPPGCCRFPSGRGVDMLPDLSIWLLPVQLQTATCCKLKPKYLTSRYYKKWDHITSWGQLEKTAIWALWIGSIALGSDSSTQLSYAVQNGCLRSRINNRRSREICMGKRCQSSDFAHHSFWSQYEPKYPDGHIEGCPDGFGRARSKKVFDPEQPWWQWFQNRVTGTWAAVPWYVARHLWYQALGKSLYFEEAGDHADEMETSLIMYLHPHLVLPLERAGEGKEKNQ